MLAKASKPMLRRRSAALEVMLSSLETAGDLLSGSECSSLAASPIDESVFTSRSQSSKQEHGRIGKSQLGSSSLEPVDMVREFLNHLGEPHAAKQFIAQDAKVGCHSRTVPGEHKEGEEALGVTKGDLEDLLASCSSCDIKIDGIFACGEDVAAFGHFAYSDGLESVCRDVHFSIWACVNVAREKIVELRWLDQFVRFEGGSTDGR